MIPDEKPVSVEITVPLFKNINNARHWRIYRAGRFSMMNLPTLPDQTVKQTSTLTLKKPLKVPVQRKSAVLNPKLLP